MSKAGQKIIAGLQDAVAGNFSRVTIDGQVWVKHPAPTLLCELEAVRQKMSAEFHGIGEPAIAIPPDKLLVTAKDGSDPKMRMCDFIELVRTTLDRPLSSTKFDNRRMTMERHEITEHELDAWLSRSQWQLFASCGGPGSHKRLEIDAGNDGRVFRVIDRGETVFLGADKTAAIAAYNAAP